MFKKSLVLVVVFCLMATLALSGCSQPAEAPVEDNQASEQISEGDKKDDAPAEKPEPKGPSGSVVVGSGSMNGEFITGWGNSSYDNNIRKLVMAPELLMRDPGGKLHLAPYLEKRDISDDGLVHTFTFNDKFVNGEYKYTDGNPMTFDDVIFTFDFYMSKDLTEAGGSSSLPEYLASYKKIGDNQIEFTLKEKIYTTDHSVFSERYILNSKYYLKDKPADKSVQQHVKDSLISKPIGAGPYKIVEYVENQYVKLIINEDYMGNYQGSKPMIKDLVVKITNDETELDELLVGDVDLIPGEIEDTKIDAVKADPNHTFSNYPRHGYGHLTFHNDFEAVRHREVRQAFAYMMDREVFRNAFIGPYGISTDGPYSTNYWMIDENWVDENLIKYTSDKEKVKEILESNGWARGADGIYAKDGEKLEIFLAAGLKRWVDTLNLVLAPDKTVEDFGIKVNVEQLDFSVLLDHYYGKNLDTSDRKYHMFALATSLLPAFDGYANWHSDKIETWGNATSPNSARFSNEEADEQIMKMRSAQDDATYQKAYQDWLIVMNREMPLLPLYSNDYHDLFDAKIKDLNTSPLWPWPYAIIEAYVD